MGFHPFISAVVSVMNNCRGKLEDCHGRREDAMMHGTILGAPAAQ
jgi:hypothetical protein